MQKEPDQSKTTGSSRPTQNPKSVFCVNCKNSFLGNPEWHKFCGECIGIVARKIAKEQTA